MRQVKCSIDSTPTPYGKHIRYIIYELDIEIASFRAFQNYLLTYYLTYLLACLLTYLPNYLLTYKLTYWFLIINGTLRFT